MSQWGQQSSSYMQPGGPFGAHLQAPSPALGGGASALSARERERRDRSARIEHGLSQRRQNSAFVGGIAEGVTEEVIERLLGSCGTLVKWKRVTDAANIPKGFGFCEFATADGVGRAVKILHDLPLLGGKRLVVKVDDGTRSYLQSYEEELARCGLRVSSKEADILAAEQCLAVVKEKNFIPAIEVMDRLLAAFNREELEEGEALEDDDVLVEPRYGAAPPLRRLAVSQEDAGRHFDEVQKRVAGRRAALAAEEARRLQAEYGERLQRWEQFEHEAAEASRQHLQMVKESAARLEGERDYAMGYLSNFDDVKWMHALCDRLLGIENGTGGSAERMPMFYGNPEAWQAARREEALAEGECERRDVESYAAIFGLVPEQQPNVIAGTGATTAEQGSEAAATKECSADAHRKRPRPTAADCIFSNKEGSVHDSPVGEGGEGMASSEEEYTRLFKEYQSRAARLIREIPQDEEGLFAWRMSWGHCNWENIHGLLEKKVAGALCDGGRDGRESARLVAALMKMLQGRCSPRELLEWIERDGALFGGGAAAAGEAARFVAILWRYFAFESESAAIGLFPPKRPSSQPRQ